MGDIKGFLKVKRSPPRYRPVCERLKDYSEIIIPPAAAHSEREASRCMDCGTPFCHWACPAGNYIPEWNDLVFRKQWRRAFELLDATNSLPEITGRLCPALCEEACVLGINDDAVAIRENELAVIEYAFKKGWVKPNLPEKQTGKRIAVVGSGPAGLASASQLNKAGHKVVVFERDDKAGGILRYGIPDFKLEKWIIDRRLAILEKEGIEFICRVDVGRNYPVSKLIKEFDAVCLAGGSREPRDLNIGGRDLKGIHFAMDYLCQSNRRVAGERIPAAEIMDAKDKKIVVIGGGDTGADCVGVAHRQGAACVIQIELLDRPPECRPADQPWPTYPMVLKNSTSHQEGGERLWSVLTKTFVGEKDRLKGLSCVKVKFSKNVKDKCPLIKEIPGSEFTIEADMAIIAVGFIHPVHRGLLDELKIDFDRRGNVKTDGNFMTSKKGIFSTGDMRRGQSLVVRAISEGRRAAHHIDKYLTGNTCLPPF